MACMGLCGATMRLPMTPLSPANESVVKAPCAVPACCEFAASTTLFPRHPKDDRVSTTHRVGLLGLALALSACSSTSLQSDKIDYKSAVRGSTLEVPPDLTSSRDTHHAHRRRCLSQRLPGGPGCGQSPRLAHKRPPRPWAMYALNAMATNAGWSYNARATPCGIRCASSGRKNGFVLTSETPKSASWKPTGPKTAPNCPKTSSVPPWARVLDSFYSTSERDNSAPA